MQLVEGGGCNQCYQHMRKVAMVNNATVCVAVTESMFPLTLLPIAQLAFLGSGQHFSQKCAKCILEPKTTFFSEYSVMMQKDQ